MGLFDFLKPEEEEVKETESFQIENPAVKDYMSKIYGDKYSDASRDKLKADVEDYDKKPNVTAALAALGAGLQGRDAMAAGQSMINSQTEKNQNRLKSFDQERSGLLSKNDMNQKLSMQAAESDPNSEESKLAQQMAIDMGVNPQLASKLTAAKLKAQMPFLEKKFAAEQARLARKDAASERSFARNERRDDKLDLLAEKKEEKMQGLKTPYGLANTPDDAKQLKQAHESKQNFDSKIQEMISLRKEFGAEQWNTEAIDRGKQLSKDLLLEYKNMAKLGVLSAADEAIINAIIPKDPLEWRAASLKGMDPIMNNLQKFKEDSDKDFQTRIATRTREGISDYASGKNPSGDKKIVKQLYSPSRKQTKVVYSDGTEEVIEDRSKVAGK
jgi:hypothetical protein